MKKIAIMLMITACLSGMTACNSMAAQNNPTHLTNTVASSPEMMISVSSAKDIALETAGISKAVATTMTTKLEYDNNEPIYSVNFSTENGDFVCKMDAYSGEVLTFAFADDEKSSDTSSSTTDSVQDSHASAADNTPSNADDQPTADNTADKTDNKTTTSTKTTTTSDISKSKAKAIALENAGVKSADAHFTTARKSGSGSNAVYKLAFYTETKTYEYVINASTGKIKSHSEEARLTDVISTNAGTSTDTSTDTNKDTNTDTSTNDETTTSTTTATSSRTTIGTAKAKSIALQNAGVKEADATFKSAQQLNGNDDLVYELNFYTDSTDYTYIINAYTGDILTADSEQRKVAQNSTTPNTTTATSGTNTTANTTTNTSTNTPAANTTTSDQTATTSGNIGIEKAKAIALNRAALTGKQVSYKRASLTTDDGKEVYIVEFIANERTYTIVIDAKTGAVISYDFV
jgi:uncharacterized membrane protein YkoI